MGLLGFDRIVYLSHVNVPGMPIFPGDPEFELRTAASVGEQGFYLQEMRIGEHSGTHWGAPAHFNSGEATAEEIPAEDLVRPVCVIDVRGSVASDTDYELSLRDVEVYEMANGRIPDGAIVAAWTGFQDRWREPASYLNADESGVLHYPGFGVEATAWLIGERKIGGLGIDSMGVDPGRDTLFRVNQMLLRDRRIHLENLTGLEQMPANGGWIVVGGVRNLHGSGGPATVFGLIP